MVEKQYGCPVEFTLDKIGGKWKCVILWWLRRGTKRFGELMQLMPGISRKVLTTQLRELEADGLIGRQVFQETPPRVEYSLTAFGETLRPITELMCDWGKANAPQFQFGLMCLRGLHILAIATPLTSQRLEAELGELRGAKVTTVSLAIALNTLNQICPNIVLIDYSIDEDFDLLHESLKTLTADSQKPIPAVALIANDQERDRAISQGFPIHLMEPVETSELVGAIANLTSAEDMEGYAE
ncbi:MAG: helix-turn-helix transcriptional regulator [Leptolyngbyaceae cyanobacterium SL_5_9]|nr:helix-turn-helix transcriptional regulator [Leptolyngbyaceae cyanobacterium SL_5_9]NJO75292.1 helix-turn-helix transcriptional regulator [Leptolyngbyaceae cyanobacterium RM1_406_9]